VRSELVDLHASLLGQIVAADSEAVSDAYALFAGALAESGDPRRAWTLTIAAMLQHPRFVYY
jgi:hypothetical protein